MPVSEYSMTFDPDSHEVTVFVWEEGKQTLKTIGTTAQQRDRSWRVTSSYVPVTETVEIPPSHDLADAICAIIDHHKKTRADNDERFPRNFVDTIRTK